MSSPLTQSKRRELTTKAILVVVFLAVLFGFVGYMTLIGPGLAAFTIGWLDLVLLSLATYRLGHLVAYDLVMEPVRRYFTDTIPDPTGAGESVEPKGEGFRLAIGQLVSCPICSGTWIAAILVYGLYLWPAAMRIFLVMTAVIGAAELLNAAGESLAWSAQHQRTLAGAQMAARKRNIVRIEQPCEEPLLEREDIRSVSERIIKRKEKLS